jgi:hypothetical protein
MAINFLAIFHGFVWRTSSVKVLSNFDNFCKQWKRVGHENCKETSIWNFIKMYWCIGVKEIVNWNDYRCDFRYGARHQAHTQQSCKTRILNPWRIENRMTIFRYVKIH